MQRKIHELIEAAFNGSKNHARFIINPNIDTAVTQLNISKKQTEDGGERSIKIEPVARSTAHFKSCLNEGALRVER